MASSIILAVKSVFDDAGLKKAQRDFGKVGKSLKGVLAGVGIGVGIGAIVSSLTQATKAAAEDAKEQKLLANQLRNTVGATDAQIAANEQYVKSLSLASGITDSELRPALANAVRATGSLSTAQNLLQIGLDGSAQSGKGLNTYMAALTKAQNGNYTALYKLEPQLKKTGGSIDDFADSVEGAAKANADPFARFNIAISEIWEGIGTMLLPIVEKLANFITDVVYPAFDKFFTDMNDPNTFAGQVFTLIGEAMTSIGETAETVWETFAELFKSLGIDWADIMKGFLIWLKQTTTQIQVLGLFITGTTESLSNFAKIQTAILKGDWTTAGTLFSKNAELGAEYYKEAIALIKEADKYDPKIMPSDWKMPDNPFGDWIDDTIDDTFADFTKKLKDDAKKLRAINVLMRKGLSEGLAEAIVGSGDDWVTTYNKIVNMGKGALGQLQKTWNATSRGLEELTEAKKAEYEKQKKADEEYADSVKSTFADIRNSIMSAFDITQMGKTAGGLLRNVNKLIAQTKAFADNIRSLAGQGLNAQLLNQLIMAGPMEGGRLAASLAASGAAVIGDLNTGYSAFQGLSTDIAAYGTLSKFGDKANPVINVTINAGMGTDGATVGKQVVDAILKYERNSGKIFARA